MGFKNVLHMEGGGVSSFILVNTVYEYAGSSYILVNTVLAVSML
jgi:hypothetical protein